MRLTFKVHFPSDPRVLKDRHGDFVLPVVFFPECRVLDLNVLLDIPFRNGNLGVVAFPVPTLVDPVGDRDWDAQQQKKNRVSGDSAHHPW